jgi:hypothetical protein
VIKKRSSTNIDVEDLQLKVTTASEGRTACLYTYTWSFAYCIQDLHGTWGSVYVSWLTPPPRVTKDLGVTGYNAGH